MNTPIKTKKPLSPGMRVFRVVAIGCGLMAAVVLVVVLGGVFWAFSPGEQVEPDRIVAEESVSAVRADDLLGDPGVRELVDQALGTMGETNRQMTRESLPENMRWISGLQRSPRASDYKLFIPKEVILSVEEDPTDPDDVEFVVAANFRGLVRPVRKLITMVASSENPGDVTLYRDHEIVNMDDAGALTFHGGTLLLASDASILLRTLDRLLDGTPASSAPAGNAVAIPEGDWDVEGVVSHPRLAVGVLDDIPPDGFEHPPESDAFALSLGVDVTSADEARFESVLECGSVEAVMEWMPLLEDAWAQRAAAAAEDGLELEVDVVSQGTRIRMQGRLTGIQARIAAFFEP